jgi:hypothetical protein
VNHILGSWDPHFWPYARLSTYRRFIRSHRFNQCSVCSSRLDFFQNYRLPLQLGQACSRSTPQIYPKSPDTLEAAKRPNEHKRSTHPISLVLKILFSVRESVKKLDIGCNDPHPRKSLVKGERFVRNEQRSTKIWSSCLHEFIACQILCNFSVAGSNFCDRNP